MRYFDIKIYRVVVDNGQRQVPLKPPAEMHALQRETINDEAVARTSSRDTRDARTLIPSCDIRYITPRTPRALVHFSPTSRVSSLVIVVVIIDTYHYQLRTATVGL